MKFNEYKGQTIGEIISDDPEYLAWAIDNVDWFKLDSQAEEELDMALFEVKK